MFNLRRVAVAISSGAFLMSAAAMMPAAVYADSVIFQGQDLGAGYSVGGIIESAPSPAAPNSITFGFFPSIFSSSAGLTLNSSGLVTCKATIASNAVITDTFTPLSVSDIKQGEIAHVYAGTLKTGGPCTITNIDVTEFPKATLSVSATTLSTGQHLTIKPIFTRFGSDNFVNYKVSVVSPSGVETILSNGTFGSAGLPTSVDYTPKVTGTYTFKAYLTTLDYPTWRQVGSLTTKITVQATASIPTPTLSISASSMNVKVGTPVVIMAHFAAAPTDTLVKTQIQEFDPNGTQSVVVSSTNSTTSPLSSLTYMFIPKKAGTYVFKPYVSTKYSSPNLQTSGSVTVKVTTGTTTADASSSLSELASVLTAIQNYLNSQ